MSGAGYDTVCLTGNSFVSPGTGLTQGFEEWEVFDEKKDRTRTAVSRSVDRCLELIRKSRAAGRPFFMFLNAFEQMERSRQ